ncbi:MAG: hypothetical protein MJD61_15570 [Proteobacteria bacterium]|nr:hypothetical protein [Pseudomonadota bacterium]
MRSLIRTLALTVALSSMLTGCFYAGIAASGDAAIVARNDAFLFGALRKVYVCKITSGGLTQCSEAESP